MPASFTAGRKETRIKFSSARVLDATAGPRLTSANIISLTLGHLFLPYSSIAQLWGEKGFQITMSSVLRVQQSTKALYKMHKASSIRWTIVD